MKSSLKALNWFLVSLIGPFMIAGCMPSPSVSKPSVSGLKTEAGIVLDYGYYITVPNSQIFPSVMPTKAINVRVYRDPDESIDGYKTFSFDYTNKTNPLLEKELFYQLGKILEGRGLVRVKENPQILISMDFFIGKKEQYTPPTTVTSTKLQTVWNTGMIGWTVGGYSSQVPVTSSTTQPGYTTTSYYSNIRLNFLDYAKLTAETKPELPPVIWIGEVDNHGDNPDIRAISLAMFSELAGEFPSQSGKASDRYVRCFNYGGLGLGFDPSNWNKIVYVEPSSPAARQGVKAGDLLVKINGKPAGVWSSLWTANDSNRFRSADPYFKFVLSNKGDSDVDFQIKSAQTGQLTNLKMKPRYINRFMEVTSTGLPVEKTTAR